MKKYIFAQLRSDPVNWYIVADAHAYQCPGTDLSANLVIRDYVQGFGLEFHGRYVHEAAHRTVCYLNLEDWSVRDYDTLEELFLDNVAEIL